jgi:hypothetical protein
MAEKNKLTQALWQEWKQNPKATAEQWGIDWTEWEKSMGQHDWKSMSYTEFQQLVRKSRWAGLWDWTP